ncbi:hypothetical protein [Roseateles oligotrophus]|uniref:Uncharacterized protein n=1 Tax=Roseateles oligotrophus TaxID=1769250 RepID=A0ABT2YJM4_9BURK|nr:hypothetical protein [Roseateles oligotrophus]MCV2370245.1 hypothetical protein [Roseateles oligotrophus]
MLDRAYVKTEAGRAEIKSRGLVMSRSVRNLLLMIDGGKTAAQWLTLVQGIVEADFEYLLMQGLIADASPAAASMVEADLSPLDYEQLYGFLTRHAKQYLGLMKGYRMVLDVERCGDLAALRLLGQRFVAEVSQAQGAVVADQVRRALSIGPAA